MRRRGGAPWGLEALPTRRLRAMHGGWRCTTRFCLFFFQAEAGMREVAVTGVQTCALPISIADDIGLFLMSLQDQARQLEPVTRGSHDEALHAGRDQALPQDPAPCTHRAIIGKITRSEIGRASCRERV